MAEPSDEPIRHGGGGVTDTRFRAYGHMRCGRETNQGGKCMKILYRGRIEDCHWHGKRASVNADHKLVLWISDAMHARLEKLRRTGLYGDGLDDVANHLMVSQVTTLFGPPLKAKKPRKRARR